MRVRPALVLLDEPLDLIAIFGDADLARVMAEPHAHGVEHRGLRVLIHELAGLEDGELRLVASEAADLIPQVRLTLRRGRRVQICTSYAGFCTRWPPLGDQRGSPAAWREIQSAQQLGVECHDDRGG